MFKNYLSLLDGEHIYFLDSDIQKFKQKETLLDDEIKVGNIQFAFDVFEILKQRVQDRNKYVAKLLKHGFDLTKNEEYLWKRKDAPWAKNEDEWNELWRKRIKNEYIRRIIGKEISESEKNSTTNTPHVLLGPRIQKTSLDEIKKFINTHTIYASDVLELNIAALISKEMLDQYNKLDETQTPEEFIQERYNQFLGILEDCDNKWVLQKYLSAFARAYDPHCDYMSPETSADFDIDMKLSLVGIGAMLHPDDGAARIVSLVPGGPADRDTSPNHLRPGDKIIAVAQGNGDFVSILHWPLYKAVKIIRGEKGTKVVLKVIPVADPSGSTTKIVTIIRDEVKLEDSAAKSEIRNQTDETGKVFKLGIVKLPAFYADMSGRRNNPNAKSASRDVSKILMEMRDKNVDGLILDLRNNGGGSLLEAVLMTGLFIKTGPTVQVRERRTISILPDNNPTIAYSGPMVVLVNRLSASASEILAAAMQDYGRAVIVGDSKTHGKGTVQTILRLSRDASMGKFKVTNALFYRISGGSTQLRGVTPDIVVPSAFDYMEFGEEYLTNPMEWTTIRSAIYSPFSDLSGVIPQLAKKSLHRRQTEKSYIAYTKLLKRIKKSNEEETISLNIKTRRGKAQEEQEMLDIQNKLMEQGQSKDSDEKDIVKDEALKILVDLIHANQEKEKEIAIGVPAETNNQ